MKTSISKMKDGNFNYYRGRDWVGWFFPFSRFARVFTSPFSRIHEYVGVMCPCSVCDFSGTCKDCPKS